MIGNSSQNSPSGGWSMRELLLVAALLSGVAAAAFFVWEHKQAVRDGEESASESRPVAGPMFSSRVLNELAKENKKFAAWAKAVENGTETNDDWTAVDVDDDVTKSNSPEFIARSRQIADPSSATGRVVAAASVDADGGVNSAGGPAVTRAAGTNAVAPKKSRVSSRMSSEELQQKTQANIAAKLKEIAQMPWSPQAAQLLNQTLAQWAKIDPQAAMNYALSLDSRRARVNSVNTILGSWARSDPASAQAWFLQNMPQDPLAAQSTVRQLYSNIGTENLNAALTALWQLPSPDLQKIAMQTVMSQLVASGDPAAVASYFSSMTDPVQKNYLALSMAQTWAGYQPAVAAEWISKISDPVMVKQAVPQLAASWAFEDPEAATKWAAELPTTSLRNPTLAQTTKTWAKEDPVAAADYVLTLSPPQPQADPAIQGLVGAIMYANPQGAMMWANSIADPNVRISLMKQSGQVWLAQDPAVATAYIMQSDLPVATKNQMLGIKPAPIKTPTSKKNIK